MRNQNNNDENGSLLKKRFMQLMAVLIFIGLTVGGYFLATSDLIKFGLNDEDAVKTNVQTLDITVEIDSKEGDKKSYEIEVDNGTTAFDMLKKLDEKREDFSFESTEFGDLGALPTTFNEYKADENSEYWAFLVNGVASNLGISSYELQNGDTLLFEITEI